MSRGGFLQSQIVIPSCKLEKSDFKRDNKLQAE